MLLEGGVVEKTGEEGVVEGVVGGQQHLIDMTTDNKRSFSFLFYDGLPLHDDYIATASRKPKLRSPGVQCLICCFGDWEGKIS